MTNNRHKGPKGSEIPILEWLEQIGATDISYVGDRNSPPDFTIVYSGKRIAVEVVRLLPNVGWEKTKEIAFERELRNLVEEIASESSNPRWHSWCHYDPRDSCPSRSESETWKERARKAFRTGGPGGEFQLLSPKQLNGRGIILELNTAGNQGSFGGISESEDEGFMIEEAPLVDRLVDWIDKKSSKVRRLNPINGTASWWLVFDDEIVMAPATFLEESRDKIENCLRERIDTELWSKIVLVSRFQWRRPPPKQPTWFWPLWENSQCEALPDSPC